MLQQPKIGDVSSYRTDLCQRSLPGTYADRRRKPPPPLAGEAGWGPASAPAEAAAPTPPFVNFAALGAAAGESPSRRETLPQPLPPSATGFTHLSPLARIACPPTVAPDPDPGPSLDCRGSLGGWACSPPAAAIPRAMDGPRLGGRGDKRGCRVSKRSMARAARPAGAPDASRHEMCACGSRRAGGEPNETPPNMSPALSALV